VGIYQNEGVWIIEIEIPRDPASRLGVIVCNKNR
jgi:hypothetical protein